MVIRHREEMQKHLDWHVDLTAVTSNLVRQKSRARGQIVERVGDRLMDAVTPDALESGPAPGKWREDRLARRPGENPFSDILVVIRDVDADNVVVKHAAIIAKREQARLMALLVLKDKTEMNSPSVQEARQRFENSCQERGIRGEFAIEPGRFARKIVERAAWTDLLALSLIHQPGERTTTGFGSEFNRILQRSPRPVLIVPEQANRPGTSQLKSRQSLACLRW
jgi:nucleotide-binding universal stress UspA family protein